MHKHKTQTLARFRRFLENLHGQLYSATVPIEMESFHAPGRISYSQAMQGEYTPLKLGTQFLPVWSTHWVRVKIHIPNEWKQQEVHLLWDSSCEACVWKDGEVLQGLTGIEQMWGKGLRVEFALCPQAAGGEALEYYLEVACNGLFGQGQRPPLPQHHQVGLLRQAEIGIFDREIWELFCDFFIISGMAEELPGNTPRAGQALRVANDMINACHWGQNRDLSAAKKMAREFLSQTNGAGQHNISAIGHAHIDTAWLWPIAETKRKCYRTFSTALRYIDQYPQYKFVCSQAQQYQWMKDLQPELYERMKQKIATGNFIPAGGTWIEPDCNIPSGESLVRQFLYGKRFFRKEFGIDCQEFWNPDVFGYSAQLPQIMKKSGIRYFLTQKLSWNQFNQIPSHTFMWEGIDGSQVLTHFPPTDTYNAECSIQQLLYHSRNYKDHEKSQESYLIYGYGDGGGGPTPLMIEILQRLQDVEAMPRIEMRGPQQFFQRLEEDSKDLLTWVGELYFEMHRGTYTTQAWNKRYNRKSELLLHDLEFLWSVVDRSQYPQETLEELWKLVLLNQFHDIIPGSSIQEVYQDSTKEYQYIAEQGNSLLNTVLDMVAGGQGENVFACNTLGHSRREIVAVPCEQTSAQKSTEGKSLAIVSVPAMGYSVTNLGNSCSDSVTITEDENGCVLENNFIVASFQRDGRLQRLYHKQGQREVIAPQQCGNHLLLFDDNPNNWDAWDVDIFHLEKYQAVAPATSMKIVENGPLRVAIEFEYSVGEKSVLKQTVYLDCLSARIDFVCEVDWHESQQFLKVEFPWNLRAMNATYEVQFGHIERPTHTNTSWDMARFEVCGHRWGHLGEPDFGVALMNDCKYGYSAHKNVMRLSLLRSPKHPDPEADMGKHLFTYSIFPHTGNLYDAKVIEIAKNLNSPLHVRATSLSSIQKSFFETDKSFAAIDSVKKAEDSAAVIVRIYESHGKRGKVSLASSLPFQKATLCDLQEQELQDLLWQDGKIKLEITPFEILTVKLS